MLPAILQSGALLVACILLYRLVASTTRESSWLSWVIALGFAGRAIVGQLLFWISWAELPVARSLQLGRGLWFFAMDAELYLAIAGRAAAEGPGAIAALSPTEPSVVYIRSLASGIWLFGGGAAIGLLLNLACFAGGIALIQHWAQRDSLDRRGVAVAIVALSFSPSLILWSLQPLKDAFVQFLFVVFVASAAALREEWRGRRSASHLLLNTAGMIVSVYAMAGIRWYVAACLVGGGTLFLMLMLAASKGRRLRALVAAAAVLLLLRTALVHGAGPYLPPDLANLLNPFGRQARTAAIADTVVAAREGFDRAGGSTLIQPGSRLTAGDRERAARTAPAPARETAATATTATAPAQAVNPAAPPATAPPPASQTAPPVVTAEPAAARRHGRLILPELPPAAAADPDVAHVHGLYVASVTAWHDGDTETVARLLADSPDVELTWGSRTLRGKEAREVLRRSRRYVDPSDSVLRTRIRRAAADHVIVTGEFRPRVAGSNGLEWTVDVEFRKFAQEGWRATRIVPASGVAEPLPSPPSPPAGHGSRILTGATALIVPQQIAMRLGLIEIGGGRGMIWFTDLATLVFDILLIFTLMFAARRMRGCRSDAVFWTTLAVCAMLAFPLAYSVSNFGTLFRLREMIFMLLVLLCVAVSRRLQPETAVDPA